MKRCIIFLLGLFALQSAYSQNRMSSISNIINIGSRKIAAIEKGHRNVEKTLYETIFKDGELATSSYIELLSGNRRYRVLAFPDETDKIARIYLKVYERDNDTWKLYRSGSSASGDVDIQIDTPPGSQSYKFEVSCTFKNSTDTYVRYGLLIDREL